MANAIAFDGHAALASTFEWPTARGVFATAGLVKVSRQSLPTDPIGNATLTLAAANASLVDAEIRIYDMDNVPTGSLGTELAGVESCPGATFAYPYFYGITANLVWIQVMAPGFEEYGQEYTLTRNNTMLSVILQAELNT